MTKEITKAYILQQMQDKFKLRDLEPSTFSFLETVIPTYDIEQHLKAWKVKQTDVSITAAPVGYLFYIVPDNEKWVIRGYNVVFMAAGAYTVTGLYIQRGKYAANTIYVDMVQGQTVSYAINPPEPITLEPGDRIYIYIDSYTSTADLRLYIDCQVETVR